MIARLKALWASLPHQLQAAVVTFATAAGVTITHTIADGSLPSSLADCKHLIGTATVAGVAALRVFYMLPNGTKAQPPQAPPDVPKAS